jgi:organic radical activating enzyme
MPQPPTLKISEIFFSAAGEGLRQGEPTIFIRLSGCNLRCPFCDTKYAWKSGEELGVDLILRKIVGNSRKYSTEWVCLTGGEPLLQEVGPLVRLLKRNGYRIHLETNGTRSLSFKPDWLTVSPKPPDYQVTRDCRKLADELKLVVTRSLKLEEIKKLRRAFSEKIPLLLQPQSHAAWSYKKAWKLYLQAVQAGLKNIRLSCQLHKIYAIK